MANNNKKLKIKDAGSNLSLKELQKLQKSTGKDPLKIMSKALNNGQTLGNKVVNAYNTPGGLGSYVYSGTPSNLEPLKGLSIGKGNVYSGASSYTTPSSRSVNGGYSPGSVTYNPIVTPKATNSGGNSTSKNQGLTYKGKPLQDGITYQLNNAGTAVVGKVKNGLDGIGWTTNPAGDRVLGRVPTTPYGDGPGDGVGDGESTNPGEVTNSDVQADDESIPGGLLGGGLGRGGAKNLRRKRGRLYRLGIKNRGTDLLNRSLLYGNALNS